MGFSHEFLENSWQVAPFLPCSGTIAESACKNEEKREQWGTHLQAARRLLYCHQGSNSRFSAELCAPSSPKLALGCAASRLAATNSWIPLAQMKWRATIAEKPCSPGRGALKTASIPLQAQP